MEYRDIYVVLLLGYCLDFKMEKFGYFKLRLFFLGLKLIFLKFFGGVLLDKCGIEIFLDIFDC